jgi:hypothetical protein
LSNKPRRGGQSDRSGGQPWKGNGLAGRATNGAKPARRATKRLLPEFDTGSFLVADPLNGQLLSANSGPLQIVSAHEVRHSRWVKQLILLRIKVSTR